jgi:hypothetical protein
MKDLLPAIAERGKIDDIAAMRRARHQVIVVHPKTVLPEEAP